MTATTKTIVQLRMLIVFSPIVLSPFIFHFSDMNLCAVMHID